MRAFNLAVCAFALAASSAHADGSDVRVRSGTYQLSGDGLGCVSMSSTPIVLRYGDRFATTPAVEVFGSADAAQDGVSASVIRIEKDYVVVAVTTFGRNGNQVCAGTKLRWTASV